MNDEISFDERLLGKAVVELLKPAIDGFERPNSGVVVHMDGEVYVFCYDGATSLLTLTKHSDEDDPVCQLASGERVVMESGLPN